MLLMLGGAKASKSVPRQHVPALPYLIPMALARFQALLSRHSLLWTHRDEIVHSVLWASQSHGQQK